MVENDILSVTNDYGERLDILVEGQRDSSTVVIFVHGYGTDKDEGFLSHADLSVELGKYFTIVRFDQNGYGKSEGAEEEYDLHKATSDLRNIINTVRSTWPNKKLVIQAHSLGTFVVAMLSPDSIEKISCTGLPNANTDLIIRVLQDRIRKNGGEINEEGVTTYKRTSGAVQLIGKDFWRTLQNFNATVAFERLGAKTQLRLYRSLQDDVLSHDSYDAYKTIAALEYKEVNGDHNFTNATDRKELFADLLKFFEDDDNKKDDTR